MSGAASKELVLTVQEPPAAEMTDERLRHLARREVYSLWEQIEALPPETPGRPLLLHLFQTQQDRLQEQMKLRLAHALGCRRRVALLGEQKPASPLFQWSLAWAWAHADEVYVLSPRHGLVALAGPGGLADADLPASDLRLEQLRQAEREHWGRLVAAELVRRTHDWPLDLTILAADLYADALPLERHWTVRCPLRGLRLADRLKWLKAENAPDPEKMEAGFHKAFGMAGG